MEGVVTALGGGALALTFEHLGKVSGSGFRAYGRERKFFIHNLLVRIHLIIVMIG